MQQNTKSSSVEPIRNAGAAPDLQAEHEEAARREQEETARREAEQPKEEGLLLPLLRPLNRIRSIPQRGILVVPRLRHL